MTRFFQCRDWLQKCLVKTGNSQLLVKKCMARPRKQDGSEKRGRRRKSPKARQSPKARKPPRVQQEKDVVKVHLPSPRRSSSTAPPPVLYPVKEEDLSLETDQITPNEIRENPSLAVDEAVKVITAATEAPKFGKITLYISNLYDRVHRTMTWGSKLSSLDLILALTSPQKMECVLGAFAAAQVNQQSFVDVFLQYFKVLQMGSKLESRNVAWTRDLKVAVEECVTVMNDSFLPAFIAAATLCSSSADVQYIRKLDAENRLFSRALRKVELAMVDAAAKSVPVPLKTRIMSMAWNVMWYMFIASLAVMIVAFVIFYAQLQLNRFTPIYRELGDEYAWLKLLEHYNVPSPIVSFIRTVLETNSAPAFWADVQNNVLNATSWWSTGTTVLGSSWLPLLNAVFNPTGAVFSFVSKWTRIVRWTNLLVSFSSTLSSYIIDPLLKYIVPEFAMSIMSSIGLTSIAVSALLTSLVSYQNIWHIAKLVYSLGKYTVSLVTTTRTLTLGYTCDADIHACTPVTNIHAFVDNSLLYGTLDACARMC